MTPNPINRHAVTLKPTQTLADWLKTEHAISPDRLSERILGLHSQAFLAPQFDFLGEINEFLEDHLDDFLIEALSPWLDGTTVLDAKIEWEQFQEFFDIIIADLVTDCGEEPLERLEDDD